jgi:glycosyltransferase involved in cell wall biosynthesis
LSKNILYITFDGLSDPLGQSQILPYLTGISEAGYNITIISCEKKERLAQEKESILNKLGRLPIKWEYIIYNTEGDFISRLGYIKKVFDIAKSLHLTSNFSLVHCRSYLSSLIGLKFKKKYNIPFIFDMRGFWADERIDGGIWNKKNILHNLFYRYFKLKEKQFITQSNAIVALTKNTIIELQKKYNNVDKKTTIIPCCVDVKLFDRNNLISAESAEQASSTTEKDHVLIYSGSIGTWYYTKEMIDCVLVWQTLIPNIKLLIVTRDTEQLNKVLSLYSVAQRSVILSMSSSYEQMPAILSKAHAAIFFIKPSYSKKASSPTKMSECWAMNLPIITNTSIGDNDYYINTYSGGVLLQNFTTENYLQACKTYLQLIKTNTNYRQIATDHFNKDEAVRSYVSIYKRLINES